MKYVTVDQQTGVVSWDAYFDYLHSARALFPAELYAYATDWHHYSLDGENSLHDSWLSALHVAHHAKEVTLEFLGARHDRKYVFVYTSVQEYALDIEVRFKHGDRDVLAHEFRAEDGAIVHEIVFSTGKGLWFRASGIRPSVHKLT